MRVRGTVLIGLLFLLVIAGFCQDTGDSRYPNELSGFKFYETAKWRTLTPLVSSIADVRRVLGKPSEAIDLSNHTKPYPGDSKAKAPLFTYIINKDWELSIYFVSDCAYKFQATEIPADRLCSIDLHPRKQRSFNSIGMPAAFEKTSASGAENSWDEYRDAYGLIYEVYTTPTQYGNEVPGDLNRIVYGPSDEDLRKFHATRKHSLWD